MRCFLVLLMLALPLGAATIRLYLTDGTFQKVREYEVIAGRVKYFSTERSEWEEIPKELVDFERTEGETRRYKETAEADAKLEVEEKKAEDETRKEIRAVPGEAGVYYVTAEGKIEPLKQAESKMVTNKKRSVLKVLSPIPVFSGKATIEIDGESSKFHITGDRPTFYFRLSKDQRIALVKLRVNSKKTARVVQDLDVLPVVKEIQTTMDSVEIFRRQVADGLYKIWPQETLAAGEYALLEYTEGQNTAIIYDFVMR